MDYQKLLGIVESLDFIPDESTANAAIKAVLGIMLSSMRQEDAQRVAHAFPEPLTLERLRGHQIRPIRISPDYYITELALQFRFTHEQAAQLASTILHEVKSLIPEDVRIDWESHLPAGLAETVRNA